LPIYKDHLLSPLPRAALVLVLALWAVWPFDAQAGENLSDSTSKPLLSVTAAVPRNWPPHYTTDSSGNPDGFAIEAMAEISRIANVDVRYRVYSSFPKAMTALEEKQVDIVPNIGIADFRKKFALFTEPVETFLVSAFVRSGTLTEQQLNANWLEILKGRNTAVVIDNVAQRILVKNPEVPIIVYENVHEAIVDLIAGRVDALAYPEAVVKRIARSIGLSDKIQIAGTPLKEIKRGIGIRNDKAELHQRLSIAVNQFIETQKYQDIYLKWFGKPEPFWTVTRVIAIAGLLVGIVITIMIIWRYVSIVGLNRELVKNISERKAAELEIKTSHQRMTLAANSAEIGIWDLDLVNNILVWDDWMFKLYGVKRENFGGAYEAWQQGIHPDDLERSSSEVELAISGEKDFDTVFRVVQPNNEVRHIKANGIVVRDDDGKPLHMIGTNFDVTERKTFVDELHAAHDHLEEDVKNRTAELQEKDDLFEAILGASRNVVAVTQISDGKIRYCNAAVMDVLGYEVEDVIGQQAPDFYYDPNDRAIFLEKIQRTGFVRDHEVIFKKADGSPIWTLLNAHAILIKNEQHVVTEITDVTERKRAETDLKDSENRFRSIFDTAQAGISITDQKGVYQQCNEAWATMLGYTQDEILGLTNVQITHPDDRELSQDNLQKLMSGEIDFYRMEKRCVRKDGSIFWGDLSVNPINSRTGDVIATMGVCIDITQGKEDSDKFRSFYEIIPDVFVITSLETGLYVDVNDGFCKMTGYSRDDTIGSKTTDLGIWKNDTDRDKLVSALKKDGFVNNLAADFCSKDGSTWPGIMSACLIQLEGRPHILSATKDVGDIRRSEQAAVEANRVKSEFLSSMSHELRTPMNAILGFAQLLQFDPKEPLSENQKSSIDLILKGGNHLLELIEQVLELSKIEAGHLSLSVNHTPVRDVIDQSLNLIQERADKDGIKIIDQIGRDDLPVLWTDSTRLTQVLLNLLSNAVKYNRENGTVTLTCREMPNRMLRINVVDTGRGILSDKQDDLFKPFERLGLEAGPIEGTGIGLTITKKIIELLSGQIGFESEEGKGSTFWVDVPMSEKQDAGVAIEKMATSPGKMIEKLDETNSQYTILYVEDNPDNMKLMEMIIGRIGNTRLLTAYNAELGLDLAKNERPDLILMDINLPGMNGIEALQQLQKTSETKDIPVIAITAAAMVKEVEDGLKAGFKDYITKPIKVPEFMQIIEKNLDSIRKVD